MKFFPPKSRLQFAGFYFCCISLFAHLDAHLCFSRNRYKVLMCALRFGDGLKRSKTKNDEWMDKFVHIRKVYDIFAKNCRDTYNPGECMTIEEMLLLYRGRCSFQIYIPLKATKFFAWSILKRCIWSTQAFILEKKLQAATRDWVKR